MGNNFTIPEYDILPDIDLDYETADALSLSVFQWWVCPPRIKFAFAPPICVCFPIASKKITVTLKVCPKN